MTQRRGTAPGPPARPPALSTRASITAPRHDRYVRARDLPRLLPLWPTEVDIRSPSDHARLLARLRRALRAERQRGLAGHWAYDLARHVQLLHAYRAETKAYLAKSRRLPASDACD